ncbi:MAG: hypothetical protein HOB73_08610 [Planctomycetaceae bacterium]|jgi:hypothetical protein|nr:hypothetical protein [Planctomycetaceae bacterium]
MIRHKLFVQGPKWAMRDSTVHAFKAVNRGLLDSSETEAVSPAVTNPTLSETVALLIDGWSRITTRQKARLSTWLQLGKEKWD